MCELYVFAEQIPDEPDIVVSGHSQRVSGPDHLHDQPQNLRVLWAAVAQVSEEYGPSPVGMEHARLRILRIPELLQEHDKLIVTAVDVSDHIKRTVLVLFVVPHPRADNLGFVDLLNGVQNVNEPEPFSFEIFDASPQVGHMLSDHVLRVSAVRTGGVAGLQFFFGQIQYNGNTVNVLLPCQVDNLLSGGELDVRCVDHGRFHEAQPFIRRVEQQVKRLL